MENTVFFLHDKKTRLQDRSGKDFFKAKKNITRTDIQIMWNFSRWQDC